MGGCAGKNKSKTYKQQSASHGRTNASSSENDPLPDGSPVSNEKNTSVEKANGNEDDMQPSIDQYNGINTAIGQIFLSRVISISDSQLECELANLIYGNPERDYAENLLIARTFKSTDV